MKAVPKVNTDGLYIEDDVVDDSFTGVVPFYTDPEVDDDGNTPEPQLAGYTVGVPVLSGLFTPRFDLVAWDIYQTAYTAAERAYIAAMDGWVGEGDVPVFVPPEQPMLWVEGMSVEEIEELTKPGGKSELELLQQENALLKAQVAAQSERSDFIEELIAELAMMVYE